MLKVHHDELLEIALFRADSQSGVALHTVEMWKQPGVNDCNSENFRQLTVQDKDIPDWLSQKGKFAPPLSPASIEGGIRLLFCERTDYRPPGFMMSRDSFLAVQREFQLPATTLESIFGYQGIYTKRFEYSDDVESLKRVSFTIKVQQKMPIANYILAMSHDLSTGMTTAFIYGTHLHTILPVITQSLMSNPLNPKMDRHRNRKASFYGDESSKELTQVSQMLSRLQCSVRFWNHPILLPLVFMDNYLSRCHIFAWDLEDRVTDLERRTGVVFSGRTAAKNEELELNPENVPRKRIRALTIDMHTLLTEIVFFEKVAFWTCNCIDFIYRSTKEIIENCDKVKNPEEKRKDREVLEQLEFMAADAKSRCGMQDQAKQRVQAQINVLYTFIAQIDNSMNAKIAVNSARDSRAMKTLALITAVFLPGTYVATLFSTSMFSWNQSSSVTDRSTLVSNKFWIYWAVTVPLTLSVMAIWRIWWKAQEIKNEEELEDTLEMIEGNEKKAKRYRYWRLGKHMAEETSLPMSNVDRERFNGELGSQEDDRDPRL